jgi:hypothetical protein
MPQLQLPIFPDGVTHITNQLALRRQDGQVTYFNGHMPVFSHAETDIATFRMITSQFCVTGHVKQSDIIRVFGVTSISVKRSVKIYREKGRYIRRPEGRQGPPPAQRHCHAIRRYDRGRPRHRDSGRWPEYSNCNLRTAEIAKRHQHATASIPIEVDWRRNPRTGSWPHHCGRGSGCDLDCLPHRITIAAFCASCNDDAAEQDSPRKRGGAPRY